MNFHATAPTTIEVRDTRHPKCWRMLQPIACDVATPVQLVEQTRKLRQDIVNSIAKCPPEDESHTRHALQRLLRQFDEFNERCNGNATKPRPDGEA